MGEADEEEALDVGDRLQPPPPLPEEPPIPHITRERADQLNAEMRQRLARLSAIGTDFVIAIVAMGGLGWLADRWLHTYPWLLLAGVGLGLVGGTVRFVRSALAATRGDSGERPPSGRR